ncbi:ABC transporter ATP-binding protein [Caminibacter mediatlanticus]|uniref:ABC transporter, ATP-binding protein n=1 Tax=Caminibacter mediatlanticus TB-2 TaxID=391592 RepID=A0AAI9AGX9_9BACT|nr:ABC transporter ATP-binding protein [Caminibacter mediatlanticus]EDM23289.1 ABC transporter, ATP-binding protein [Caminibacter mediatlanticus TB-2]
MLKAINLSHSFDYLLFENVNLEVNKKEKIAIVGSSGSGKSTLLHILSTFLKPKSGEVFIENKNIYSLKEKELIEIRRKEIGIIFQFHYLFNTFSALENLEVAALLSEKEIDFNLLKRLKIDNVIYQNIQTLSGGQQQRVSIARVLTKKPKIIFADEPTGNLDKENANEVIEVLFEYCEENEASLITVTHDLEIAKKFDKIYLLKDKKLILIENGKWTM